MSNKKKKLRKWFNEWAEDNTPILVLIVVAVVLGVFSLIYGADAVFDASDKIGIVTGLVSTVIAVLTWYSIRRMRNAYKVATPKTLMGNDTAVMCVTCKGSSISKDVAQYLNTVLKPEEIKAYQESILTSDKEIGEFGQSDKISNQYSAAFLTEVGDSLFGYGRFIDVMMSDMMPFDKAEVYTAYFAMCLEETFNRLKSMGISKFKVFYRGPVLIPAVIGYIAKNNVALELYHYDSGETAKYTSMGAMQLSWREPAGERLETNSK